MLLSGKICRFSHYFFAQDCSSCSADLNLLIIKNIIEQRLLYILAITLDEIFGIQKNIYVNQLG